MTTDPIHPAPPRPIDDRPLPRPPRPSIADVTACVLCTSIAVTCCVGALTALTALLHHRFRIDVERHLGLSFGIALIAIGLLFGIGIASFVIGWRTLTARRRAWRELAPVCRRVCIRCGYDLRATTTACPECGHSIPEPVDAIAARLQQINDEIDQDARH